MQRIGMLIGNGLTIAACQHFSNKLKDYNTHHFFDWEVYTPGESDVLFLNRLPYLQKYLLYLESLNENWQDDFAKVKNIIKHINNNKNKEDPYILLTELQHFIAIAFSTFQQKFINCNLQNWYWTNWFLKHKDEIEFIISFNYDLVLENLLDYCNIDYQRIGVRNERSGKYIFKPHGSIDYEIIDQNNKKVYIHYPINEAITRNNLPVKSLAVNNLLKPRKEVDIVLPDEHSKQINYCWVKPGYDYFKFNKIKFTHFYMLGHSYSKCDRPEVDFILDHLNPDLALIILNPNPTEALISKVKNKFIFHIENMV